MRSSISDSNLIKFVDLSWSKNSFIFAITLFVFKSLLSLDGQEWRERRVKMTPIFTSGKMKMMFETVDSISDKLVDVFEKDDDGSREFDVREWTSKFTTDVIGLNLNWHQILSFMLSIIFYRKRGIWS
jgi:cytochrome P450